MHHLPTCDSPDSSESGKDTWQEPNWVYATYLVYIKLRECPVSVYVSHCTELFIIQLFIYSILTSSINNQLYTLVALPLNSPRHSISIGHVLWEIIAIISSQLWSHIKNARWYQCPPQNETDHLTNCLFNRSLGLLL